MIVRNLAIGLACLAPWALWLGYDRLTLLRGTPLWDFRYLVLMVAGFLGLSGLEWLLGRLGKKPKEE